MTNIGTRLDKAAFYQLRGLKDDLKRKLEDVIITRKQIENLEKDLGLVKKK